MNNMPQYTGYGDMRYPAGTPDANKTQPFRGRTEMPTLAGRAPIPGGGIQQPQYDQDALYAMLLGAGANPTMAFQKAAGKFGGYDPTQVMAQIMNSGYAPDYYAKMANLNAVAAARPAPPQPVTATFTGTVPPVTANPTAYPDPVGMGGRQAAGNPIGAQPYDPVGMGGIQPAAPPIVANPGYPNVVYNAAAQPPQQAQQPMAAIAPPMQNGVIQALLQDPNMRQAILQALMYQA